MNNDIKEVLYSQEDIKAVAEKLGQEITKDYEGKNPIVICVLKGAILFMADIAREIKTYCELDFMDVSSYGDATVSSGEVKIIKDLDTSVKDRHVLIIEDVIDSGLTMQKVKEHFLVRGAKSVKLCAFIDKRERRITDIKIDYSGFVLERGFIVGYGLDLAEKYRHLPGIFEAVVEESNV